MIWPFPALIHFSQLEFGQINLTFEGVIIFIDGSNKLVDFRGAFLDFSLELCLDRLSDTSLFELILKFLHYLPLLIVNF